MKNQSLPHGMENRYKNQEMITSMQDELLSVLEKYMEDLGTEETFYFILKFMTIALYECVECHQSALKVLKMAMDHGIQAAMEKERH